MGFDSGLNYRVITSLKGNDFIAITGCNSEQKQLTIPSQINGLQELMLLK